MTINPDDDPLPLEASVADAIEQRRPADPEDAGLDADYVARRLQSGANADDVIDQAISVPLPEDEREDDEA